MAISKIQLLAITQVVKGDIASYSYVIKAVLPDTYGILLIIPSNLIYGGQCAYVVIYVEVNMS